MSILHAYHSKLPFRNVKGKPSITVSSKGISNGLSDTYNDGADFGPDTMLGATSPDQYGPPYTQTSGIQEAYNYGKIKYNNNYNGIFTIVLGEGIFVLNADVNLSIGQSLTDTSRPQAVNIIGQGTWSTQILVNQPNLNGIVISNPSSDYSVEDTIFAYFSIDIAWGFPSSWGSTIINKVASNPTGSGANSAITYLCYSYGGQGTQLALIGIHMYTGNYNSGYGPTNGGIYIWGTVNVVAISSAFAGDRSLALIGANSALVGGSSNYDPALYATFDGCFLGVSPNIYITGYMVNIIGSNVFGTINLNYNSTTEGLTTNVVIENSTLSGANTILDLTDATVNFIKIHAVNINIGGVPSVITASSATTAGILDIRDVANTSGVPNLVNNVSFSEYIIEGFETVSGTAMALPTQSLTNGTTAGTVKMDAVIYRTSHKKYIITLNGYENDTTTNQTISFPLPFEFNFGTVINTTSLSISANNSEIIIVAPNSTTTYTGIIILEGY